MSAASIAPRHATWPQAEFEALLCRHDGDPHQLLQLLIDAQQRDGWLPRPLLQQIAGAFGLPLAQVEGVASFYRFLYLQPVGRYRLLFSDNITDRMLGSQALQAELCGRLGVRPGVLRDDGRVSIDRCSCTGLCDQGPALLVDQHRVITRLDTPRIARIAELIEAEVPVEDWPAGWSDVTSNIRRADVLLREHLPMGATITAALQRSPSAMLEEIVESRLRGRGGAGFPTGRKWQLCRDAPGSARHIVCNADEGEPGTFKDRVLLTEQPDLLIDGMTVAAHAIGAASGFIYLRGEYRFLLEPLEACLQRRRDQQLLGRAVAGRGGFDFDIRIHLGAGAYVCGEESALLESLEGRRGVPRIRPPFPVERGYRGQPTTVNNVETYCAAARIALHGARWWTGIGTSQSTGTRLHSISGDCECPGIYEYPLGTPISHMLADCGAGDAEAVQVGGPSGTCLGAAEFDRTIAFEDVPSAGALMVFNRSRDLFEVARCFAGFFAHESCGFCTPCRVGTELVVRRLDKLARGAGSSRDEAVLQQLDALMHRSTHCGLGASACNPLRDTLARFRPAYQRRLQSLQFEPGFDLDGELARARKLRESANAPPAKNPTQAQP